MIMSTRGHLIFDQSVDFETFSRSTKFYSCSYYRFENCRCDHGPLSIAIPYFCRSSTLYLWVKWWVVEIIKVVVVVFVVEIDHHNQPKLRFFVIYTCRVEVQILVCDWWLGWSTIALGFAPEKNQSNSIIALGLELEKRRDSRDYYPCCLDCKVVNHAALWGLWVEYVVVVTVSFHDNKIQESRPQLQLYLYLHQVECL